MTLRPFWRYYGGKWLVARRYPAPCYDTIVEPFAGAAGYSLRYPDRRVILVEKYPVVAEMWRWLVAVKPDEVLQIPIVDDVQDLPSWVPSGARSLVGFAMNSGTTHPCSRASVGGSRMNARPGKVASYGWTDIRRSRIASQVEAIKHWKIIEGDYQSAPNVEATWFIDPPYNNTAGEHYLHHEVDYPNLSEWCRNRTGQVMVCENGGATWLPFKPLFTKHNAMTGKVTVEAIWTNTVPVQLELWEDPRCSK